MRKPTDTDFFIELPDVGQFRFGRRTFGDRAKVKSAYLSFVGQNTQNKALEFLAELEADPPEGWDAVKGEVYQRIALVDGTDPELAAYGNVIATYSVLCVSCPPGWENLEKLDITGNDNETKVFQLHTLLRDQEDSFRT
jgi:hypothetical protein